MLPPARVAILLFTRSAGEEAARKRFLSQGSRADNAAVAARLIDHAAATAHRAGVELLCVDSAQQAGATFGERLTGAVRATFALGYEHLLVIGNDCPQLTAALLRRAVAAVQATGAVLGPATDGGVYLLGLSRALFEGGAWLALPWQTRHLGAALRRQLRQLGAVVRQLPALTDVDDEAGLAQACGSPWPGRCAAACTGCAPPAGAAPAPPASRPAPGGAAWPPTPAGGRRLAKTFGNCRARRRRGGPVAASPGCGRPACLVLACF